MTEPLSGIRVLDFGQYIAGPLTALLLADLGAEVVRVEHPDGPRWSDASNAALLRARAETHLLNLRDHADRARALDLVRTADVLVENFRPGVMDRLGLGATTACALNPGLVYCSLPGFGYDDERAGIPGWEGVVLASAGAYAPVQGSPILGGTWWPVDGPKVSPLPLASVFGAFQGALGIVAALVARERDERGQRVEVALADAFLEALSVRALSYERNIPGSVVFGTGFYHCSDGRSVVLATLWHKHLDRFCRAAGLPTPAYEALMTDPLVRQQLSQRLVVLFATRTGFEWEELGRSAGVPIGAVRSASEWMAEEHAVSTGTVVEVGGVRMPGPALRVSQRSRGPAHRPSGGPAPLADMKVLDLSRVLAAPTASRLLADLGADVTKIDRDPTGTQVSFREPAVHEFVNRGKDVLVADLTTERGRAAFRERARDADVVLTNFTRSALPRLGIDEDSVREIAPDVVYVHLDTFGDGGPFEGVRGYAEIANAVTGISERTLDSLPPSGAMATVDFPRCPFTDSAAGILGALGATAALFARARHGGGWYADTSLVRTAMYEQLPYVVFAVGDGPRSASSMDWAAEHQLEERDGEWEFVADADPTATQRVATIAEVMALGGPADRRGLRVSLESDEFGTVVQQGTAIKLERTPARVAQLPPPFRE